MSRHLRRYPKVRAGHPDNFRGWCQAGVWARILTAVAAAHSNFNEVHADPSHARSHVSVPGPLDILDGQT